jgi:hypothetical protein
MVWPFNKKRPTTTNLIFRNGVAFFEYQCKFGHTDIKKNTATVAIVLDSKEEFGTPSAITVKQDGSQLAALRVASDDGGFIVFAATPIVKRRETSPR